MIRTYDIDFVNLVLSSDCSLNNIPNADVYFGFFYRGNMRYIIEYDSRSLISECQQVKILKYNNAPAIDSYTTKCSFEEVIVWAKKVQVETNV
jgi:hypothetical protein